MIALALAKQHLEYDDSDRDDLIQGYIEAADAWVRRHCEITDVDLPALRQAQLLLVGHWFANRESVAVGVSIASVPLAVESLCAPYWKAHL